MSDHQMPDTGQPPTLDARDQMGAALPYRSATTLVGALTFLFVAYAGLGGIAAGSDWMELELLDRARVGPVTEDEAIANDVRQGLIGLAQVGLYLATVVAFCVWVFRANRNARALGRTDLRFTAGWCVGWFFVPIMNLFKPFQAVREIWQASDPDAETDWNARPAGALLGGWWALWLIGGFIGQAAFRTSLRADSVSELLASSWLTLASDVLDIPMALVAMMVVRSIHDRQERRHQRLVHQAAGPPASPAPWSP